MTDERLCVVCGHPEFAQDGSPIHIDESEPGGDESDDFCRECVREGIPSVHPFEAAPSTDEGEARERLFLDLGLAWMAYWARRHRLEPIEQAEETLSTARRNFEAAIRAPLEERIRELNAVAFHTDGIMHIATERIETLEAENERLREALRKYLVAHDVWSDREHIIDRVDAASEYAGALANLRALATPPSSTEGTEES